MLYKHNISIISLLLLWSFVSSNLYAQSFEDIEKLLLKELKNAYTPQDSADIYNDLAYNYRRRSPKDILAYANLAVSISASNGYTKGLAAAYKNKGIAHYKMQADSDTTLFFYNQAIAYAIRADDYYTQAACYNNIGLIQTENIAYNQALQSYLKGLSLFDEKLEENRLMSLLIGNMGAVYQSQGEHEKAREYYERALSIAERQENNTSILLYFLRGLSSSYMETEDVDKAIDYLQRSFSLQEELGDYQSMIQTEQRYALIRLKQNKKSEALVHAKKAYDLALKYELEIKYSSSLLIISKVYIALNQLGEADKYAHLAYEKSRNSQFSKDGHLALEQLATISVAKGNYKAAYQYLEKVKEKDLNQKNEELEAVTKEMEARYENEEKIRAIKELELAAKQNSKQIRYLTGFLLLVGILLLILANLYRNKNDIALRLDQKNKEIVIQSEELQKLNDLKDKLFSIISHDLKSPIASLENSLSLLLSGEFTPKEFMAFSAELKGDTVQLRKIVEELMNWSYMQMLGLHPNPDLVNLRPHVEDAIGFCGLQAKTKHINLVNEVSSDIELSFDQEHLSSILRNLISNGIKFSNPNQTIRIGGCKKENQIVFYVKDEGVGIPKENLQSIFDIGVTNWGTAGEKGTGLGLPLCKEFTEKNGGTIHVESILGKGSTFIVSLPSNHEQMSLKS